MDDLYVTTVYVILDHLAMRFLPAPKYKPKMSVAEIILVAIVAARYFENNQERALLLLRQTGLIPKHRCLSVSRYNRQLHQQGDFLELCRQTLLELARQGEAFVIDSMPVPVCKRVRARRCRKVRGADFCGVCVAKKEKFFGWRLHLICTLEGIRKTCNPIPGGMNGNSKNNGDASKPATVNSKAWASSVSRLAPIPALTLKFMLPLSLFGSLNPSQISNQGKSCDC